MVCWKSLYSFQIRRFFRLYPLHFLILFGFLSLEILKYVEETYLNIGTFKDAFTVNSFDAFIYNLFLLQNFFVDELTWNFPSWSISAEFYTYAVFGIFIVLTRNYATLRLLIYAAVVLFFGYIIWVNGFGTDTVKGPSRCFYSFFIGCLVYQVYQRFNQEIELHTSLLSSLFIIASIISVSTIGHFKQITILLPFLFAVTIFVIVSTNGSSRIYKILENKYLVYLGTISYGVYIIHAFVWGVLTRVLRFVFDFPTEVTQDGGITIIIENKFMGDIISVIGVLIVILLAGFSHHFIEKPLNQYAKRIL